MDSPQRISAANGDASNGDYDDNEDLEFSFFPVLESSQVTTFPADFFSGGVIQPIYPLFNQDLLSNNALESKKEEEKPPPPPLPRSLLDGIPDDTYCMWAPAKDSHKKSRSKGSWSASLKSELRDLAVVLADVVSYNKEMGEKEKQEISYNKSASANEMTAKMATTEKEKQMISYKKSSSANEIRTKMANKNTMKTAMMTRWYRQVYGQQDEVVPTVQARPRRYLHHGW